MVTAAERLSRLSEDTVNVSAYRRGVFRVTEGLAAGDSIGPRAKQLGRMQPLEFPAHEQENLLQHVIRRRVPDHATQIAV